MTRHLPETGNAWVCAVSLTRISVVALLTAALGGCSSNESNSTESSPTSDTPSYNVRLGNSMTESTAEGWACSTTIGESRGYIFAPPGTLHDADPSLWVGLELDGTRSISEQKSFGWTLTGADSVMLDMPHSGEQVEWTQIVFASNDDLSANSSALGRLRCSRETIQRR